MYRHDHRVRVVGEPLKFRELRRQTRILGRGWRIEEGRERCPKRIEIVTSKYSRSSFVLQPRGDPMARLEEGEPIAYPLIPAGRLEPRRDRFGSVSDARCGVRGSVEPKVEEDVRGDQVALGRAKQEELSTGQNVTLWVELADVHEVRQRLERTLFPRRVERCEQPIDRFGGMTAKDELAHRANLSASRP